MKIASLTALDIYGRIPPILLRKLLSLPAACVVSELGLSAPCRQHRIDVDKVLKAKGNILTVTIKPAVPEALARKDAYPYAVPFVQVTCSRPALPCHRAWLHAGTPNAGLFERAHPEITAMNYYGVARALVVRPRGFQALGSQARSAPVPGLVLPGMPAAEPQLGSEPMPFQHSASCRRHEPSRTTTSCASPPRTLAGTGARPLPPPAWAASLWKPARAHASPVRPTRSSAPPAGDTHTGLRRLV